MKGKELKIFVFCFISIAVFMSFASHQVSWLASKILTISGERAFYVFSGDEQSTNASKKDKDDPLKPKQIKKNSKETKQKPKTTIDLMKQEVRTDLPKTNTPIALLIQGDDFDSYLTYAPPFPDLRNYTGENWNKEKTQIFCLTNNKILFIKVICFDSDPDSLVKMFSIAEGSANAWKDDSIEVFLMSDPLSEEYYQFLASASGKTHYFVFKIRPDDPRMGTQISSNQADKYVKVEEFDKGYIAEFYIPLTLLNFKHNL
ncbi:MAG TPA: hypothetical protein PLN24_06820, partial [Victivallales bacterium]|nr:hypothetical protein [Victivallales bacterium]